jgi:SAM-dependent methyltransferase
MPIVRPVPRTDDFLGANQDNWNDRTPIHLGSDFYDVEGWIRENRGPRAMEAQALGDVTGLRLAHLQCHIGLDTLAWARVGAVVTGLDFSDAAIEAARDIASRAGLSGTSSFVCADVHDAAQVLGESAFDVVYVSLGALCWLPSVAAWADQVSQLLVPGGRLYLHDVHPLLMALGDEQLEIEYSYFEEPEPVCWDDPKSYTDGEGTLAHPRSYQWSHGIAEIVSAVMEHGLCLERLEEHDWLPTQRFSFMVPDGEGRWIMPADRPRIPLSFSLLASKG